MGPKPIPPPSQHPASAQLPHDTMGILSDPKQLNVTSRAIFNALDYAQCSRDIQKWKITEHIEKKHQLNALGFDKSSKVKLGKSQPIESKTRRIKAPAML
jgi:hypothetical protein